ncbi:thiol:disulfide interchange protein DsbA/DsbL [Chitinimonas koreensis]|uniref:thiol:disulfide interchange protein DsbA/DsbL n=1 Tax=Chitinimonas koreensis TaxID=356302 RepID=UPI0003F581A5|nr:thiol:disulfide interchange protein DsbA/DsbL [Chitinimonas koreensis]QNM95302.1 thiol:disulfide interchange protein DsbA/DsbL [Chitinimonas koreensis]
MHSKRLLGRAVLALGLTLFGVSALAHGGDDATPVTRLKTPQPVEQPGKIEVIEFFWYGCPHCNQLEPLVNRWERTLPKDVVFRREHVLWDGRSDMDGHARLFATLKTMGLLTQQKAVFDAIHGGKVELRDEMTLFEWVAKRGIDRRQFEGIYKSFGMGSQLARAKQLTRAYGLNEVPAFVVNGKYLTSPHQAGGGEQMFALVDRLIAGERAGAKR